ncbi:unnamed protein product [Amoebophrya sp. A25]|nr:unnamed protein product [Amoebophrya sp. A25]|eukprot:GSA25T00006522001.1
MGRAVQRTSDGSPGQRSKSSTGDKGGKGGLGGGGNRGLESSILTRKRNLDMAASNQLGMASLEDEHLMKKSLPDVRVILEAAVTLHNVVPDDTELSLSEMEDTHTNTLDFAAATPRGEGEVGGDVGSPVQPPSSPGPEGGILNQGSGISTAGSGEGATTTAAGGDQEAPRVRFSLESITTREQSRDSSPDAAGLTSSSFYSSSPAVLTPVAAPGGGDTTTSFNTPFLGATSSAAGGGEIGAGAETQSETQSVLSEQSDASFYNVYDDFFHVTATSLRDRFCRILIRHKNKEKEVLMEVLDLFLDERDIKDPPRTIFTCPVPSESGTPDRQNIKEMAAFMMEKINILDELQKAELALDPRWPVKLALYKINREKEIRRKLDGDTCLPFKYLAPLLEYFPKPKMPKKVKNQDA